MKFGIGTLGRIFRDSGRFAAQHVFFHDMYRDHFYAGLMCTHPFHEALKDRSNPQDLRTAKALAGHIQDIAGNDLSPFSPPRYIKILKDALQRIYPGESEKQIHSTAIDIAKGVRAAVKSMKSEDQTGYSMKFRELSGESVSQIWGLDKLPRRDA